MSLWSWFKKSQPRPWHLSCEICGAKVTGLEAHYVELQNDPHRDGYWKCHADVGKWRCATVWCHHLWKPKNLVNDTGPACPICGEDQDVFPADDGAWESVNRLVRECANRAQGISDALLELPERQGMGESYARGYIETSRV